MSKLELIAHRGYRKRYPENTLIGIEAAVAAGARYVEVDIQLSRDRVPLLFHDDNLQRICGVQGKIHQLNMEEIRHLRAMEFDRFGYKFTQNPITPLGDLCRYLQDQPKVTVFIELKRSCIKHFGITTVLRAILPMLQSIRSQSVLISYNSEILQAAFEQGWTRLGAVVNHWYQRNKPHIKDLRLEYLFVDADGLPFWGKLRHPQYKVAVFEIDDPRQALALHRRGVDMIETYSIAEMIESIGIDSD